MSMLDLQLLRGGYQARSFGVSHWNHRCFSDFTPHPAHHPSLCPTLCVILILINLEPFQYFFVHLAEFDSWTVMYLLTVCVVLQFHVT